MQSVYKEAMRSVINRQAEALYRKMELKPGFDIAETVTKLDGEIYRASDLEEGVDAKISASENGQSFVIECKDSIEFDDKYMRFAIAHELGHLFLHMIQFESDNNKYKIVGNYNLEPKKVSINEWEAEEFAAAFLMPDSEFRMQVDSVWTNKDVKDKTAYLSDVFKVPYKNIITRGKGLEIW